MVDLKAYLDSKVAELIGPIKYLSYPLTSWSKGGSIRSGFRDILLPMDRLPSTYIPRAKRGEALREALKGLEDYVYERYEKDGFKLNSKPPITDYVHRIACKTFANPAYSVAYKRKLDSGRICARLFEEAKEHIMKVHTDCMCGVIENPVAAFKELINTDWTRGFNGDNIPEFSKQEGQEV